MYRPFAAFSLSLCLAFPAFAENAEKPKQLVIVSFDGAGDNTLWERSRATAKEVGAHFTYFLACTLVMDRKTSAKTYQGPGQKAGRSKYGYDHDIRAHIDRKSGGIELKRHRHAVPRDGRDVAEPGELGLALRGRTVTGTVVTLPFTPHRYKR